MTPTEAERLDSLLRTKPKDLHTSSGLNTHGEQFRINDRLVIQIIASHIYFDIIFWIDDIQLNCWIFMPHNTPGVMTYLDSDHHGGKEKFIADVMENYPDIFEWFLWNQDVL